MSLIVQYFLDAGNLEYPQMNIKLENMTFGKKQPFANLFMSYQ